MEKILNKKAKDFMTTDVIAVKENESIKHLFRLLDEGGILGVPVVDDENRVTGIVTETDLVKHFTTLRAPKSINLLGGILYLEDIDDFNKNLKKHCAETVKDLMLGSAITVSGNATLLDVINTMSEKDVSRLPVVDNKGRLLGIITRTDVVHQLAKIKKI